MTSGICPHAAERCRHIGVRAPARDGVVDALPVRFDERDVMAAAGTLEGVPDDMQVRLPGAEHFIETVSGEIGDELVDAVGPQAGGEHLPRHVVDAEPCQGSVAVEGDEPGPKSGHGEFP